MASWAVPRLSEPVGETPLSYNASVPEERPYFYDKTNRRIEPSANPVDHERAKVRLNEIKTKYWDTLPSEFREKWDMVSLYSPSGSVESANAVLINPDDGAYDLTNKINHLTGKQWVKFSCSWFIFNALPSDLAEEKMIDGDSAKHPATYSPTMISEFIRFFTKEGEVVFDPFMGIGTTLVACKRTNREGYGIELNPQYFEIALKRVPRFASQMYCGSAEEVDRLALPEIDFCISSPPYWDVLNRSTKDFRKNREDKKLDSRYSDSEDDLGNVRDYKEFINRLSNVYLKTAARLRKGAYMVVVVKNVKKEGKLYPLAWDLAGELAHSLVLKDEKIWIQDKVGLAPYGYPHSWASNILHHYCLVFQKP